MADKNWAFGDAPLYRHQELATRSGVAGRPFLVTTGTGSGKTESFLLPVIDHCIKAQARGELGVKAILLYPMNALANHKLERPCALLRGSGLPVSFGYSERDRLMLCDFDPHDHGIDLRRIAE